MTNDDIIKRLNEIGFLPAEEDLSETYPIKEFIKLIDLISLPIDCKTAISLLNLSPPINTGCCEVEWSLIHLVETIDINDLKKVIKVSKNNEVKRIIEIRVANSI